MIRVVLQMFAKSTSEMQAYRKSKAASKYNSPAGSTNLHDNMSKPANRQEEERKKAEAETAARTVTSSSQIVSRETYEIYNAETNEWVKESSGSKLRDSIAHETLRYDKKTKSWVTKKGKYIIRRKR